MTYTVSSGTLNPTQLQLQLCVQRLRFVAPSLTQNPKLFFTYILTPWPRKVGQTRGESVQIWWPFVSNTPVTIFCDELQ